MERLSWLRQWQIRPEESMAISDSMIAMRPDLFNAYGTKATTLIVLKGNYLEAEKYTNKSLTLFDGSWVKIYLGGIYIKTNRKVQGVKYYEDLMYNTNISSDDKSFLIGYFVEAISSFRDYEILKKLTAYNEKYNIAKVSQQKILKLAEGIMYKELKQYDKADSIFKVVLAMEDPLPSLNIEALSELGDMAYKKRQFAQAKAYFDESYRLLFPMHWDYLIKIEGTALNHLRFYTHNNDTEKIKFWINLLDTHRPFDWQTPIAHAILAAKNKNKKETLRFLQKAVDLYLPLKEHILEEEAFVFLHGNRKFNKILKKINQ